MAPGAPSSHGPVTQGDVPPQPRRRLRSAQPKRRTRRRPPNCPNRTEGDGWSKGDRAGQLLRGQPCISAPPWGIPPDSDRNQRFAWEELEGTGAAFTSNPTTVPV